MHTMSQRAHIFLPDDLLREIDALVGPRGRSAFLVETARKEVRRQKLLHVLESDKTAWHDADHTELTGGAGQWVRTIRRESEESRTRAASSAGLPVNLPTNLPANPSLKKKRGSRTS